VLVHGVNAVRSPLLVKRRLGYITCNESSFYGRLNGWQNLAFFARLHNLNPKEAIPPLARTLKIESYLNQRFFTYSTGIKRRFDLARGLIHQPDVLLLDEPTTNLDPMHAAEVRDLLVSMQGQGKSMIIVTHRLDEVQKLAQRLAIMKNGRLREIPLTYGESLEELYRQTVQEGNDVAA